MDNYKKLFDFLAELKNRNIWYSLSNFSEFPRESIMIETILAGERWEIEFMSDGTIEIEKFKSDGKIFDERELEVLFREFSD